MSKSKISFFSEAYNYIRKLRQLVYKEAFLLKNSRIYKNVLSDEAANKLISNTIKAKKPCMITRFGSVESNCVYEYMKGYYKKSSIHSMSQNAGFFPLEKKYLDRFSQLFLESSKSADILGVWQVKGEPEIIKTMNPSASLIKLSSIEPYYHKNPWSQYLYSKKVLVIHPFTESISSQYKSYREKIFADQKILPEFELITIKAVQSVAGNSTQFNTWFDAYESMCENIDNQDFDVAIIGCGAYGLPLAAHVKRLGKQAIHMGGATQILFGIKGKRWDENTSISPLYNDYWTRPSSAETVANHTNIESGCYW